MNRRRPFAAQGARLVHASWRAASTPWARPHGKQTGLALAALIALLAPRSARAEDPPSPTPERWFEGPSAAPTEGSATPADAAAPSAAEAPEPAADEPSGDVAPDPSASGPRVHHAPVVSATAQRDLVIDAGLDDPHLVRELVLVHQRDGAPIGRVTFRRTERAYRAVLPAEAVQTGLRYAIEVVSTDGTVFAAFATREAMFPVQVLNDATDEREAAQLSRLGGRRSLVGVSTEIADFGPTRVGTRDVGDSFWRVEGRYTYRPLRTVAEFSIRGGVVRGGAPRAAAASDPNVPSQRDVGLNYGAPSVRLRMADLWHLEIETLASVSDEGFSTGGGANLLVGDPYGSKLVLGTAFVGLSEATYFGSRFFSRVDLAVHERVVFSPTVEVTDMPNAELFGVRLLGDVAVDFGGGFSAHASGGYQARVAASGGVALGAGVTLGF